MIIFSLIQSITKKIYLKADDMVQLSTKNKNPEHILAENDENSLKDSKVDLLKGIIVKKRSAFNLARMKTTNLLMSDDKIIRLDNHNKIEVIVAKILTKNGMIFYKKMETIAYKGDEKKTTIRDPEIEQNDVVSKKT